MAEVAPKNTSGAEQRSQAVPAASLHMQAPMPFSGSTLVEELLRTFPPDFQQKHYKKKKNQRQTKTNKQKTKNQARQSGTILVFHTVPVKDFEATTDCHEAELLSLWAAPLEVRLLLCGVMGKGGVVVPAPTGTCSPGASKRSEIMATHAHHRLHQHRTGTHWLSHNTLYPLPSNTICTKRNR